MRDRVVRVVSDVLGLAPGEVTDETSPDTVEAWDSLQHMNLIFALEDECGVQFSDDEIVRMLDIATIVRTIEERSAAG